MKNKYSQADHYTKKAKSEGYQARSVYKLQEIQKKNKLIKSGDNVLDIGAAPGSWSRFILKTIGKEGRLTAVDLNDLTGAIKTDPRMDFIQGDFYQDNIINSVKTNGPFNVILSDAAPATSGNRTVDTAKSEALVEHIIHLAEELLADHGSIAVKIFQGGGEKALLDSLRSKYKTIKLYKPTATRKSSFEAYLIGIYRESIR